MLKELVSKRKIFFVYLANKQIIKKLMKSSNTSTWDSLPNPKLSSRKGIIREVLLTTSTRELVEFYWTNRKRFSGGYKSFPIEVK